MATKADLINFQEKTQSQLTLAEQRTKQNMLELEYRITTRIGFLVVSTTSIAVALLTWLIKA